MGALPGMTRTILTLIAVFASLLYIASPPALTAEAFHLSSLAMTTPHQIVGSQDFQPFRKSTTTPVSSGKLAPAMPNTSTSLKGTIGDDDVSSSSLPSSSILNILITKIGSTTSIVVAGTFFVVLCYQRDALMVSFFLGAIGNAIFGKLLKKILKIERPEIAASDDDAAHGSNDPTVPEIDRPSDNGMPSSHAMSLGFICTFVALLLPKTTVPLIVYAAISLIYRVRVNLHTVDQIAVGAVLGTFDGAVWMRLCTEGFRGVNIVELVSSSGIMNEHGRLSWYLLAIPALIGAAVVGSVERRLERYFGGGKSDDEAATAKNKDE